MRQTALTMGLSLGLTLLAGVASAQTWNVEDRKLPDMGSSAARLLTPAKREEYGSMMLAQLRHYNMVFDDPLTDRWLNNVGHLLGRNSARPADRFTFFMMDDRQINAFATLGGYIGMNAGLVLAADREDEVASVLGHEIAHVTQDHVLRSVERAQRDQLPMMLAMLGAVAAMQSGGRSSGNAAMAVMTGAMGIAAQRQINYTRSGEQEADRIGIQTLIRSGYDANAMPAFFSTLQNRMRANAANYYGEDPPEYLMTHPVTTTRISETQALAQQYLQDPSKIIPNASAPRIGNPNSLLPKSLRIGDDGAGTKVGDNAVKTGPASYRVTVKDSAQFGYAKERIRVLSEDRPGSTLQEYLGLEKRGPLSDAQQYGKAVALLKSQGKGIGQSIVVLKDLQSRVSNNIWIDLTLADALSRSGDRKAADTLFENLVARYPGDRAVSLTYADSLTNRDQVASAKHALEILRPLEGKVNDDPGYWLSVARAAQTAGDPVRAGIAFAENAYVRGLSEQSLVQFETLKRRNDLDYYTRARIDDRIAKIKPLVLELRRQGLEDPDLHGRKAEDPQI